ncbi:MAG: Fic family protein [Bacillota bacterium]|nr:Fic family protein [Bacillota bacterium]
MRNYDYDKLCENNISSDIVSQLTKIHEYKGQQILFMEAKADVLERLVDIAKIQSTEASNRIEGIFTSKDRLENIVKDKTTPRNRNEEEIAGYRDVLATIHENHNFVPPKPNVILQLHRDLYKFSGMNFGGNYKTVNNVIAEKDGEGKEFVRFQPLEAWETPEAIEKICEAYEDAVGRKGVDPLLAIPAFILDFLCIHPFNDGNGRMSRLLTLLLLYRADYIVGKYISIEKLIEETKETYYEALQQSSQNWHEGENDYRPFTRYILGIIISAYDEFSSRVEFLSTKALSKQDRVREVIKNSLGKITKREILEKCPDISTVTVQRTLATLLKSGEIIKISGGRYAAYMWNREKK